MGGVRFGGGQSPYESGGDFREREQRTEQRRASPVNAVQTEGQTNAGSTATARERVQVRRGLNGV